MTYRDQDTLTAQAAIMALRPRSPGREPQCRWPTGHVDSTDFRFCASDAIPGSKYCACHDWDSRAVKRGKRPASTEFAFVGAKPGVGDV